MRRLEGQFDVCPLFLLLPGDGENGRSDDDKERDPVRHTWAVHLLLPPLKAVPKLALHG